MFGGIIRFFCCGIGVGRHVRRFKYQIDDQISCGPETSQQRKPADDEHMRHNPSIHAEKYSRSRRGMPPMECDSRIGWCIYL